MPCIAATSSRATSLRHRLPCGRPDLSFPASRRQGGGAGATARSRCDHSADSRSRPLRDLPAVGGGRGGGGTRLAGEFPKSDRIEPLCRFRLAAQNASGWEGQEWDKTLKVPVTTLDRLIAQFGLPSFIKIDVEGFEDRVLAGLSHRVRALSFEFTTIARDNVNSCVTTLEQLGPYRFNVALGESHRLHFAEPVGAAAIRNFIASLPHDANSGDIYAEL